MVTTSAKWASIQHGHTKDQAKEFRSLKKIKFEETDENLAAAFTASVHIIRLRCSLISQRVAQEQMKEILQKKIRKNCKYDAKFRWRLSVWSNISSLFELFEQ